MIPVRIDKDPEIRDDFSHLGRYVAAAKEKGEKLDKFWISNCDAGAKLDDLETALIEIEATRTMKREIADKTYHLVVSFRPGEEEKLSQADLEDIERNFAEALGYGDHQRVAGTHINTDNFHMHIAINKVHPTTFKVHTPRRDFATLEKVARAMEQKYGLYVDKGKNSPGQERISTKAKDYEAKTWQQSFERHVKDHQAEILAVIDGAADWRQVHEGLAGFDIELRKRGAGMVFAQVGGQGAVKASALDRACSLAAMEKRFGPFVPAPERDDPAKASPRRPTRPYEAKPLTRHPATSRLWRTYRQEKKSSFLRRNVLNLRSWRDYLLADAHKDALALAIIVTYKEVLHCIDEALTPRRSPYRAPRSISPALKSWYAASPWKQPSVAINKDDVDAMNLRTDDEGKVLFPLRDRDGHVWALRAIDAAGRACDIGDSARPNLSHVIDPAGSLASGKPYSGPIILTADALAAAAIHSDTEIPVLLIGREDELSTRARELRAKYPDSAITVAAPASSLPARQAAKAVGAESVEISSNEVLAAWAAQQAGKGKVVSVERSVADTLGAFVDDALSPLEAMDSRPQKASPRQIFDGAGKDKAVPAEPDIADILGAFVEDALSPAEAKASQPKKGKAPKKEPGMER